MSTLNKPWGATTVTTICAFMVSTSLHDVLLQYICLENAGEQQNLAVENKTERKVRRAGLALHHDRRSRPPRWGKNRSSGWSVGWRWITCWPSSGSPGSRRGSASGFEAARVKERSGWGEKKMESFEKDGHQSKRFVLEGRRSKKDTWKNSTPPAVETKNITD